MEWVGVWWCGWWWGAWWGGWLEGSWGGSVCGSVGCGGVNGGVGEYMHPPHPGVLGMMGGWAWARQVDGHDGWVGMMMAGGGGVGG